MRDNKGLSLIELIVVIAIMAILSVGAFTGLSTLTSWNVNKCVSSIDGGLNTTKMVAMSKKSAEFTIYYDSTEKEYYMKAAGESQDKLIGKDPITIKYTIVNEKGETDNEEYAVDGTGVTLKYDRSTGAFKALEGAAVNGEAAYCKKIIVTRGTKERTITLVPKTGKHSVNE